MVSAVVPGPVSIETVGMPYRKRCESRVRKNERRLGAVLPRQSVMTAALLDHVGHTRILPGPLRTVLGVHNCLSIDAG